MLRFVAAFLSAFFLLTLPAQATLAAHAADHTRSAFAAMHRHDWDTALNEAKAANDPVLVRVITWQYVLDPESRASFDDIARFIADNPDWPGQTSLDIRAEQAMKAAALAPDDVINWFGERTPVTGAGKIALAEALIAKGDAPQQRITDLIRDAWKDGDFDQAEETRIATQYSHYLRKQDDTARIDRLLWEEKTLVAKRLLPRVSEDYQKLYAARIALINDKKLSAFLVFRVPHALKYDPGLIYDRMAYRARKGDDSGVRDMLLLAPVKPPYPEKWWKQREAQIRAAIGEHDYALAKKLLTNRGILEGNAAADALWLEGWLDCEFLNKPKDAYTIFSQMYDTVEHPVSRSRAAFWAARAAEKSGDQASAARWYATASAYPTNFYGQFAALKANGNAPLRLPDPPVVTSDDRDAIAANALANAAKLCLQLGEDELAGRLLGHLAEHAENDAQAKLAADIGMDDGHGSAGVRAAKKAMQHNVVLLEEGYPAPPTPKDVPIERALTLAIVRQESEFDAQAKSASGALGLMQLLPSTAKELAKKLGMSFSHDRLSDPDYNMTLGSHYLGRLIAGYNGSYIMAIAAYNAGPGNVHNWVQRYGTPGNNADNAVDWIEKIPFSETRNYVQRVLENVQLYRHIESGDESEKLRLAEDLQR